MAAASSAEPGPEQLELADEDDDEPGARVEAVSFFAGDEHEIEVCSNVWRMYLRDSVSRRTADPAEAGRALERTNRAEGHAQRSSNSEKGRARAEGEPMGLKETVAEHHATFQRKSGRPPTAKELYESVGDREGKHVNNVRSAALRADLPLHAARGAGKPVDADAGPTSRRRPKASAAIAKSSSPPRFPVDRDGGVQVSLAIMALQAEREKIAAELAAVDKVIDRLRAP